MDILAWENPSASRNSSHVQMYPWSNQQNEIEEIFFDPSIEFRGFRNVASDLSLLKQQEVTRLVNDNTAELCSAQLINNQPYNMSSLSNSTAYFGNCNGGGDNKAGFSTTGSLESLECLLSNNSNTDTSVEDDGISMIFSDCRNIWDFNSGNAVSSSGESENNFSNNLPDETVSQTSSNPCNNHDGSSYTRPSSSKRSKEQRDQLVESNENYRCFGLPQSNSITTDAGFRVICENPPKSKKARLDQKQSVLTSSISFQQPDSSVSFVSDEPDTEAIAQMKEMIYRAAAFRPVNLGLEVVEKPIRRKNVRISRDPQTVAARQRRERISERIRVLQKLVPGGSKMDTASMLDEAANYLKFLRSQVKSLQTLSPQHNKLDTTSTPTHVNYPNFSFSSFSSPFNSTFLPMQTLLPFSKP